LAPRDESASALGIAPWARADAGGVVFFGRTEALQ
jgi:hypothetical protein